MSRIRNTGLILSPRLAAEADLLRGRRLAKSEPMGPNTECEREEEEETTGADNSANGPNKALLLPVLYDPHHFDADLYSTYHPDADPDSDFYLKRISGCGSGFLFDADADQDPTFPPDADPDPDPSFQIKVQTL
jgi:hypothetical protein